MSRVALLAAAAGCIGAAAAEPIPFTLAGPAMGTTYRVTLAREVPGMSAGEVHREVETTLARLDRALSTWRDDSDAARLNRGRAGEWIEVSPDLVAVVEIARKVHAASRGAFDITAAPAGSGRPSGVQHLETRSSPPSIRRRIDGLAIDLGGIGPGYAVDAIGERLAECGSRDHLVELGGEVRAWGGRTDGVAWRVRLEHGGAIDLAAGEALGTSTVRPGRSPIDPRTGLVVRAERGSATARGNSCAEADAWAVAAVVLGLPAGADGTIVCP